MTLRLTRPLVWVDTETTGTSTQIDRIVQVGLIKCRPDAEPTYWDTLVNPTIPIPPESTEIHHITDEMVRDAPTFAKLAPVLHVGFEECDFGGYNIRFDLSMIGAEFARVNRKSDFSDRKLVDGQRMYHREFRRNLTAYIKEMLGEEHEGAHGAPADISGTRRAVLAHLERNQDLPRTVEGLHEEFFVKPGTGYVDAEGKFVWRYGEACFNFGKFPGIPLRQVSRSYLNWMMNAEFSPEIKKIVSDALDGKFPVRIK